MHQLYMLQGIQYKRATRGLTLCYEVMLQAFVIQFLEWIPRGHIPAELWEQIKDVLYIQS